MGQGKKASAGFLESETIELKLDYSESIRKDMTNDHQAYTWLNTCCEPFPQSKEHL